MAGRRNTVWKTPDLSGDWLRRFGCITLLLYSIGVIIVENGLIGIDQYTAETFNAALETDSRLMTQAGVASVLQLAGGLALPVFAFLLTERFIRGNNYWQDVIILAVAAVAAEIPYDLGMQGKLTDWSQQNVLVAFLLCYVMLGLFRSIEDRGTMQKGLLQAVIAAAAFLWMALLRAEAGFALILLTVIFYLLRDKLMMKMLLGASVSILYVTGPLAFYPIWCYREDQPGKIPFWFCPAFYVAQLLILTVIRQFL